MSINDSKIEFIEDGRLTDLAGGVAEMTTMDTLVTPVKKALNLSLLLGILQRSCFSRRPNTAVDKELLL